MLLGTTTVCEFGLFTASVGKQKKCVGGSGLESLMGIQAQSLVAGDPLYGSPLHTCSSTSTHNYY